MPSASGRRTPRYALLVVAQRVEKYVPARPSIDTRAATTAAASAEQLARGTVTMSWRTSRRQPTVAPVVEQEAIQVPARCADELGRLLDRMQNERRARETVRLEHRLARRDAHVRRLDSLAADSASPHLRPPPENCSMWCLRCHAGGCKPHLTPSQSQRTHCAGRSSISSIRRRRRTLKTTRKCATNL